MSTAVNSDLPAPVPARPVAYVRSAADQAAFEQAVARLRATDAWVNPQTGQRELNADLVLEGGGVKGIGLAGAILVLAEAGYHFPRAAGTSAGAIAAVLVAAIEKSGQDMTVLQDYLADVNYQQFMQASTFRRIFERVGGRFADECEVATWADLAITMADDPDMSLPEGQRYRAVVHTSDISRGMLARLPWDYQDYYGLPPGAQDVAGSVRASMSIPFFFVPVRTATRPSQARMPDGSVVSWPGGTVTWVDGGMLM